MDSSMAEPPAKKQRVDLDYLIQSPENACIIDSQVIRDEFLANVSPDDDGYISGADEIEELMQEANRVNLNPDPPVPLPESHVIAQETAFSIPQSTHSAIVQQLLQANEISQYELVKQVLALENLPDSDVLQKWSSTNRVDEYMLDFQHMLLLQDNIVVKHLIKGDLPRAISMDPILKASMNKLAAPGDNQPGIYTIYLVDRRGLSPTPREVLRVIEVLKLYADLKSTYGGHLAVLIDSWKRTSTWDMQWSTDGKRRYLAPVVPPKNMTPTRKRSKTKASGQRLHNLEKFINNLARRMEGYPEETRDFPMVDGITETGYAASPDSRLKSHYKHASSNYLMNLTEAIMNVLFEDRGFHIQGYTVLRITSHYEASLGEILISRLTQSYITNGGGFSHFAAGISISSINKVSIDEWRHYEKQVVELPCIQRVNSEVKAMQKQLEQLGVEDLDEEVKTDEGVVPDADEAKVQRLRDELVYYTALYEALKKGLEEEDKEIEKMDGFLAFAELLKDFM